MDTPVVHHARHEPHEKRLSPQAGGWPALPIGRPASYLLPVACCFLLLAGCRLPGAAERIEDASRFRESLMEETRAYFETNAVPLTLSNAMVLARERTLKLAEADLNRTLAQIQRATAFSSFLPRVEATFARRATDVPIQNALAGMTVQLSDQYVNTVSVGLTQPLFTPGAWLLFAEARHALRAQELLRARAGELLDVQVASLFYQAAVSEAMLQAYARQQEATRALAEQIEALSGQGYALASELARARARLASDALQLREAEDTLAVTRTRLFSILRFWPDAEARIDGGSMTAVLARDWALTGEDGGVRRVARAEAEGVSLEELLWQTLVNRKELWAGDQSIALRKTDVLRALTGFLPELYGSAAAYHTSESRQVPSAYWGGGLNAALSVFNGFRTVDAYREARARKRAELRMQEDRALTLVVATFEARQNWLRSFERRGVAAQALAAAELDYQVTQARYRESQETLSEVLDKLTALESARVQAVSAEYACSLAEIVLRDAAGIGLDENAKAQEGIGGEEGEGGRGRVGERESGRGMERGRVGERESE
jgi:outer membrane protein TolC